MKATTPHHKTPPLRLQAVLSRYRVILSLVILGGGCLGIAIGGINAYMYLVSARFLSAPTSPFPTAHTAIILGAKVLSRGRLSDMLEDRVLIGLELYQHGHVRKLLLSGDHGRLTYDEVNAMRQYLLKKGVPPQDIFLDHAGFRTYDSLYRARDIFQVQDVIVVTQQFHLARAVYTARALGLEAVGVQADRRWYTRRDRIKLHLRELLARVRAFLELHLVKPKPKYLGEVIPITGDGRQTWNQP